MWGLPFFLGGGLIPLGLWEGWGKQVRGDKKKKKNNVVFFFLKKKI